MGYSYYSTLVLIPEGHEITLPQVFERLQQRFIEAGMPTVAWHDPVAWYDSRHVVVQQDDWKLHLYFEDEAHVKEEAQELAEDLIQDEQDRKLVSSSKSRIAIFGDPDPEMMYFNEYLFVLEEMEKFLGLYIFDPNEGRIWKSG